MSGLVESALTTSISGDLEEDLVFSTFEPEKKVNKQLQRTEPDSIMGPGIHTPFNVYFGATDNPVQIPQDEIFFPPFVLSSYFY